MGRLAGLLLIAGLLGAEPKRVLFVTATYGFRHVEAIDAANQTMMDIAGRSGGALDITLTEDVSLLTADNLAGYDAVFFFTSGELPLSDQQKQDLLDFIRNGKGFGGAHSATDTLYTWPDYGDMIGGIFDGHPWAQEATVIVEQPDDPIVAHLAPSFVMTEEFYQFRNFSRDQVQVLLHLDTTTVDLNADGVHRTDGDFALAWKRTYGAGRVFYSALGHFESSWTEPRFQTMLEQALRWLTGGGEVTAP